MWYFLGITDWLHKKHGNIFNTAVIRLSLKTQKIKNGYEGIILSTFEEAYIPTEWQRNFKNNRNGQRKILENDKDGRAHILKNDDTTHFYF